VVGVKGVISVNRRSNYRNRSSLRQYVFAFALLALTGCHDWNAKAPPESKAERVDLVLPDSYAKMTIAASANELERSILETYATEPLDKGKSNELVAKILVKKKQLVQKMEDYVVTPYKAPGCITKEIIKDCPKQVARNITEKCWKNFPEKSFDCVKTIWVEQYFPCNQAYQECWPEVKEAIGSRPVWAIEIQDRKIPTSIWINHEVFLRGLSLEAHGSGLDIRADMELGIAIDLKTGILAASETVEGALKCSSKFQVTGRANTVLDSTLEIDVSIDNFNMDIENICMPGTVEIADPALLTAPAYVLKNPLERVIHKEIQRKLSEKIDSELADTLDFTNLLNEFSSDLSEPLKLNSGEWLQVNPRALAVSQIYSTAVGEDSILKVDAAVVARPVIHLQANAPASPRNPKPPISVVDNLVGGLVLDASGRYSLVSADNILQKDIRKFLKNKYPNAPASVAAVHLYQSGQQFVVGLTLARATDGKVLGDAYLWARPYVDEIFQELRLQNVRFDPDTQRVLSKVAAWLLSSKLEQFIQETAAFRYGGLFEYLQTDFDDFKVENGSTILHGDLKSVRINDIWIADNAINISATAKGNLTVSIKGNAIP
jgi:uncharacterized protein DUF4403